MIRNLFVLMIAAATVLALFAGPALAQETRDPNDGKAAQPATPATPAEKPAAEEPKVYYVKMTTSQGDIVIELNNDKAPISTTNFLSYVDKKHYDGTVFHRVIPNFMIQGGGFEAKDGRLSEKSTDKPIKNEWQNGLKNVRGSIAMARTNVPDSATSQFYINVVDNASLDVPRGGAAYAVFGKVVSGMDAVDKIRNVKTGQSGGHGDVPADLAAVTIKSAVRLSEEDAKKFLTPAPAPAKTDEPKKEEKKE